MILADYQRACLREALSLDDQGLYRYSTIIWSDIKKSIKSTIAAAVALWRALTLEWGQIVIVANDLKQADTRVGYYLRRAIELNPEIKKRCRIKNYLVELDNHTKIESVPIDPTGEAGGNADMVIFSELWGAHESGQQRMWTEMTTPPNKYGRSFRWVETYAGFTGESPLLERLFDSGVKAGERFPWCKRFTPELEAYTNRAARIFALWNTTPRLPWQTAAYYAQESAVLMPNEFQRIHRNQWVSSEESFIQAEWWYACAGDLPAFDEDDPIVVAMDAGVSGDCFGILAVSRHDGITVPRFIHKFTPPAGGKIEFFPPPGSDEMDLAYPAGVVRYLAEHYNVLEVAFDAYQLESMSQQLRADLVTYFRAFPQVMDRLVADKQLQDDIKNRKIMHDSNPDLTEHILNANAKAEGDKDNKIRIVKKSESRKIDLAVCLSMANNRAQELII